eukprot:2613904-Rhodomonas_salina.2
MGGQSRGEEGEGGSGREGRRGGRGGGEEGAEGGRGRKPSESLTVISCPRTGTSGEEDGRMTGVSRKERGERVGR